MQKQVLTTLRGNSAQFLRQYLTLYNNLYLRLTRKQYGRTLSICKMANLAVYIDEKLSHLIVTRVVIRVTEIILRQFQVC